MKPKDEDWNQEMKIDTYRKLSDKGAQLKNPSSE